MATITDASMVISIETEEIKKVIYHFEIRKRKYSLVKVWINGFLQSKIALNSDGYNITAPLIVEELENIIEESK
jgi:hypothetical protein